MEVNATDLRKIPLQLVCVCVRVCTTRLSHSYESPFMCVNGHLLNKELRA